MALVVEDGTGIAGANTFATREELITYALARGVTLPDADATDVFLIQAMDYLESLTYRGEMLVSEQLLPFPRVVLDSEGVEVFPSNTIPAGMKRAQLLLAFAASQGTTLLGNLSAGRGIKSRDVGPMKRTYTDNYVPVAEIAGLSVFLKPYLEETGIRIVTQRA